MAGEYKSSHSFGKSSDQCLHFLTTRYVFFFFFSDWGGGGVFIIKITFKQGNNGVPKKSPHILEKPKHVLVR